MCPNSVLYLLDRHKITPVASENSVTLTRGLQRIRAYRRMIAIAFLFPTSAMKNGCPYRKLDPTGV
jgi:hypothetical protein